MAPRSSTTSPPRPSWLYRLFAGCAFLVMRLQAWRITVIGAEHLPRRGGAVLATNHTSFWDFFTAGALPFRSWGRPLRILAKASLFDAPIFGWIMQRAGHIPVHRGAGGDALRDAVAALRADELVLVLPEQTISPSFELLPFKTGAVRMAAAAGVPVVPTVSWGSHRFHTVGRAPLLRWRLPVTVAYGEPLWPTADDDPVSLTEQLRARTAALLDQVQRGYPDGTPAGAWWVPARLGGGAPTEDEARSHLERLSERWKRAAAERFEAARDGVEQVRERVEDGVEQVRERRHPDHPGRDEPTSSGTDPDVGDRPGTAEVDTPRGDRDGPGPPPAPTAGAAATG